MENGNIENDFENDKRYLKKLKSQNKTIILIIVLLVLSFSFLQFIIRYNDKQDEDTRGMINGDYMYQRYVEEKKKSILSHSDFEYSYALNSRFTVYEGKQTGSELKTLCEKLIDNANTYAEEPNKIPEVIVRNNAEISYCAEKIGESKLNTNKEDIQRYLTQIANIRNKALNKENYFIEFEYNSENGIVSKIIIFGIIPDI